MAESDQSRSDACQSDPHALTDHQAKDVCTPCSHGDADADFSGTRRDMISHHAVHSDGRENQSERSDDPENPHLKAHLPERGVDRFTQASDTVGAEIGMGRCQRFANGFGEGAGISRRFDYDESDSAS